MCCVNSARKSHGGRLSKFRGTPTCVPFPFGSGKARQTVLSAWLTTCLVSPIFTGRETERATRHVLHQTLNACLIACRQQHRLIDAQNAVLPSLRVLDNLRFDLRLPKVQLEDPVLPGDQQPVHIKLRQL